MFKKYKNKFIITIAGLALFFSILSYLTTPDIAVVDFKRLVNEYQGMKDATHAYENKMKNWNSKNDSLAGEIKAELNQYYLDSASLTKEQRIKVEKKIIQMRNKYVEYTKGLDQTASEEDQVMTAGVVQEVLTFVEKFGAKKGYEVILGRNEGNDILYRKNSYDITNEVIEAMNLDYNGN